MLRPWQIYLLCVAVSGSGFVAQTLISGFWSTVFNEDSVYYSVNLAFYFGGMGVGSLFAGWFKKSTEVLVIKIVAALLLLVTFMIPLLRVGVSWLGNREFMPLFLVILAGALAGATIPLVIRLRSVQKLRLGTLFLLDYCSAFFFACVFNLYLLMRHGYQQTAWICFACGVLLCLPAVFAVARQKGVAWFSGGAVAVGALSFLLVTRGMNSHVDPSTGFRVLFSAQSPYQKIVLTQEIGKGSLFPNQLHEVMYLDGMVQFSSLDETSYHVCLANIPLTANEFFGGKPRRALILGGGDGLAARNLLSHQFMESVKLIELDPLMIKLAKYEPHLLKMNHRSFYDPRFSYVEGDAFRWIKETDEKFDVILLDFPHPKNLSLARLYSAEFYSQLKQRLNPGGFLSIQSGPAFSPGDPQRNTLSEISSAILETIRRVGLKGEIYLSPADQEAFILATELPTFDMERFARGMKMIGIEGMGLLCQFDPAWKRPPASVNTLNDLSLVTYMDRWNRGAARLNYDFRGPRAIFLPK